MTKLVALKLKERGNTPRGMRKAFNAASKAAWYAVAKLFHEKYRKPRFTEEHAREAGYMRRKGELIPRGTKAFKNSYTGRKLRIHKHTNPLMFSGETFEKMKSANISSTSKGGKAAYRGGSKFSFRHPRSKIRMWEEFQRITAREAGELGEYYDQQLDLKLAEQDRA